MVIGTHQSRRREGGWLTRLCRCKSACDGAFAWIGALETEGIELYTVYAVSCIRSTRVYAVNYRLYTTQPGRDHERPLYTALYSGGFIV